MIYKFSDFAEQSLGRFASPNRLWAAHCLQHAVIDGGRHQDRAAVLNPALDACSAIDRQRARNFRVGLEQEDQ